MRVTVCKPLTASSYWRMAAVLTELRHDAVIGLPGTQKRVAVDAPPCQSHRFNGAWALSWGFRRGAFESNRSAGVSLLFSSLWFRQGHLRRVCCPPLPLSGRCGALVVKNGLGHFCFIVLYLPPDSVGHAPKNHMTSLEQWERGWRETVPHVSEPLYVDTQLLCHKHFIWLHPHSNGSSGRSRIDFVATPPSVQFSRILVNFTAGRRLQLIPAAGPRDHLPLTMDLVTNGMRHSPDPTRGRWDHEKIEEMLSNPLQGSLSSRNSRQNIATRRSWDLQRQRPLLVTHGKTVCRKFRKQLVHTYTRGRHDLLGHLLWNEDVCYWNLAARRLTGSSGDQSLVENAKTEITRVEKQMRRFSRWLLRRL